MLNKELLVLDLTSCSSSEEDSETQKLIVALANRSYHLPNHGLWEDLRQYLNNNHPLLGIFFCHELHPVKTRMRLLILFGSILFGLTVSNIFFMLVLNDQRFQAQLLVMTLNDQDWFITSGLLMLWTVGGSVHAIYDLCIFYILSCGCCPFSNKCRSYGTYLVVIAMILLLALSSFVVLVRASLQHAQNLDLEVTELESAGLYDDQLDLSDVRKEDVRFLLGYVTEFALALLVYYPLGSLILFSGVLGCGRLPMLGGRPRDMLVERRDQQREYILERTF